MEINETIEKNKTVRIDTTLTGELAEKFLQRMDVDGDQTTAALAKRLLWLQLNNNDLEVNKSSINVNSQK